MSRRNGPEMTRRQFIGASATALAGLAAFGCAPGTTPTSVPGSGPAATSLDAALLRSAQATINIGVTGVAKGIADVEGLTHHHQPEVRSICHCPLSQYDHDYNVIPVLAERIPSVSDGSWVVNPDGTMSLTWHLRHNIKWHDGRPFTAKDVLFSWEFNNDRSLPIIRRTIHSNVTAIDVPDDYTFTMHWKVTNNFAHVVTLTDMFIYPEHIVRPLWESGEGERILTNDFFLHEFVGLGPYKIDRWNADESIVFKPFDDFFLGRPKIGTIVMHQLESSQAILTRLLAGQLQMAGAYGLVFQDGVTAQERWADAGEGKVHWTPVSLQRLILPPENPLFRDARVRKALLHAIDRDEINQTFFQNTAVVAHSLLHPSEMGYKAADAVITKYGFDPRQALALLEGAGWRRASDGVLANEAGERFEITYRTNAADREQERIQGAIANFWKDVGVRTGFDNVSTTVYNDARERAAFTGVQHQGGGTTVATLFRRWHSSYIPSNENRFIGDNLQRWNNPAADRLLEQLEATFTQREMEDLVARLAKVYTDDMPALPIYYQPEPVAIHKNLKGARPRPNSSGQHSTTWSVNQWEWS